MAKPLDTDDVWAKIRKHPIAMLTTQDGDRLVSRPMAAYARPDEGRIYFLTRIETQKTEEIGRKAAVNLAFADQDDNTYISVTGDATTSQDRAKLNELWTREAEAWLPEGPDAPTTGLITVDPDDAVIWNSTDNSIVYGAKLIAALVTQSPPDPGQVSKVSL